MKKALLFFTVFVSFSRLSFAQYAELGLSGGAALYSGDLAADEFGVYFEELNPAFSLFGRFNVSIWNSKYN